MSSAVSWKKTILSKKKFFSNLGVKVDEGQWNNRWEDVKTRAVFLNTEGNLHRDVLGPDEIDYVLS